MAQIAVYLEPSFDGIGDVLASFGQRSPLGDTAGQIRTFSDDPTVLPLAILNPHKRARGSSSPSLRHTRSPLRVNPRLRIILQVQRFISLDYSLWRWEDLNLRQRAYETPALPLSYTAADFTIQQLRGPWQSGSPRWRSGGTPRPALARPPRPLGLIPFSLARCQPVDVDGRMYEGKQVGLCS